jgi:hypothetical protein
MRQFFGAWIVDILFGKDEGSRLRNFVSHCTFLRRLLRFNFAYLHAASEDVEMEDLNFYYADYSRCVVIPATLL